MLRVLRIVRRALARSLEDDLFGLAKAGAYSAILTLFPALMVVAAVLASSENTRVFLQEAADALSHILPRGTSAPATSYFLKPGDKSIGVLVTTSLVTLWTASGMMVTWMEGFRYAYQLPKTWGIVRERVIAILLVLGVFAPMMFASALLVFGGQIEIWMMEELSEERLYIVLFWLAVRWLIAAATSVAVIAVIYHFGVPRGQRWHSVLPGATLATAIWFPATLAFGWYITHLAEYNLIYGSLGGAIAILVWLYMVSLIVLFGAEVNALLYPRALTGL
jgi:membrane protein